MDETPLNYDIMYKRKVDNKGAKTVKVIGTGHEITWLTIMSSCMVDRTKLKPMVNYKRNTKTKINSPSFHEKSWMDSRMVRNCG